MKFCKHVVNLYICLYIWRNKKMNDEGKKREENSNVQNNKVDSGQKHLLGIVFAKRKQPKGKRLVCKFQHNVKNSLITLKSN